MDVLSARLQAIADRVLPDRPVADVGCDHGLLSAWLIDADRVPRVVASDKKVAPLAVAQARLRRLEPRVRLAHADGLAHLAPDEVATVVMAGMGGQSMIGALRGAAWLPGGVQRLVLQPQASARALRTWLWGHGWHLVDEHMLEEAGRVYVVLVAEPGVQTRCEPADALLGPCLRRARADVWQGWVQSMHDGTSSALARARAGGAAPPERLVAKLGLLEQALAGAGEGETGQERD